MFKFVLLTCAGPNEYKVSVNVGDIVCIQDMPNPEDVDKRLHLIFMKSGLKIQVLESTEEVHDKIEKGDIY